MLRPIWVNHTLTLSGSSSVTGNTAGGSGGGIDNAGGTVTLTKASVNRNTAGQNGGGIYNNGAVTLTNSDINSNTASGNGGGIYNDGSYAIATVTFSDSGTQGTSVKYNTALSGGGIYNSPSNGTATVTLDPHVARHLQHRHRRPWLRRRHLQQRRHAHRSRCAPNAGSQRKEQHVGQHRRLTALRHQEGPSCRAFLAGEPPWHSRAPIQAVLTGLERMP